MKELPKDIATHISTASQETAWQAVPVTNTAADAEVETDKLALFEKQLFNRQLQLLFNFK